MDFPLTTVPYKKGWGGGRVTDAFAESFENYFN